MTMDNELVEAVARAMAVAEDDDPDGWWQDYTRSARAAISVIEAATPLASLKAENEALRRQDERVREALFVLSDRMRASGILSASDAVHEAYEAVVAALAKQGG